MVCARWTLAYLSPGAQRGSEHLQRGRSEFRLHLDLIPGGEDGATVNASLYPKWKEMRPFGNHQIVDFTKFEEN